MNSGDVEVTVNGQPISQIVPSPVVVDAKHACKSVPSLHKKIADRVASMIEEKVEKYVDQVIAELDTKLEGLFEREQIVIVDRSASADSSSKDT